MHDTTVSYNAHTKNIKHENIQLSINRLDEKYASRKSVDIINSTFPHHFHSYFHCCRILTPACLPAAAGHQECVSAGSSDGGGGGEGGGR